MSTAPEQDDRTARARIRDAALFCFARDGFGTPLRVIAERAGVSVPLITHHYGTKDNLRQVCDDWVLERFTEMEIMAIRSPSRVGAELADTSQSSILTVYMVQCFRDASTSARPFFDKYVERMRQIVATAEAAGMVNPTDDEEERVRLLAAQGIGYYLVTYAIDPPDDPSTYIDRLFTTRNIKAQIDLYSQPFFSPAVAQIYHDMVAGRVPEGG